MDKVLDFKSILLFQLCYQVRNSLSSSYEAYDVHLDSQSQENDSDIDERDEYYPHGRSNRNQNYDYEKENKILSNSNDYDECNSCACNKCDNPPDCCKEVCRSCPKPSSQRSPFQMISMPQFSQLPQAMSSQSPSSMTQILQMLMGQISMPQMQMQVPQMQMPPVSMTGRSFSTPFISQFPNQNLVYFPLSPNFMNFLRSYSPSELYINSTSSVTTATVMNATTTMLTTTTIATNTTTTSTTTPTTPLPVRAATIIQRENKRHHLKVYLQPQIENKNMLESAIKNVLKAFSIKATDKSNSRHDKYVLASALRRTKPVTSNAETYGIVPVTNNITNSLILELRDAKGIRDNP